MTPDQASAAKGVLQIPWALAATVVSYNVPGVKAHIQLTGSALANIFLGQITNWNDPKIKKLNPKAPLPDLKITPVYRSDGSGDTFVFTDYLTQVSEPWRANVGNATQVQFPTGVGAKGNDGVAGVIKSTSGAIGYVSLSYDFANGLQYALLRNAAGQFPAPSIASISEAAKSVDEHPGEQQHLDREPAQDVPEGLPDVHLHLRARAGEVVEGRHAQALPHLRHHDGPEVRREARLRAAAGQDPEHRQGDDREDRRQLAREPRAGPGAHAPGPVGVLAPIHGTRTRPRASCSRRIRRPTASRRKVRLSDLSLHGATLAGAAIAVAAARRHRLEGRRPRAPRDLDVRPRLHHRQAWNPVTNKYGAWDFLVGTLVSSIGALLIAGPLAVGIAIYLTELSPRWVRQPLAILVELLAAIPSVVLGLWGILVLGPFVNIHLEPWLNSVLGWIPLFSGDPSPVGMLPAILILALMMLPIITSISREVLLTAPRDMRDGALALGVTRWEMIRGIVLPYARPGIAAAMMLGLARALGEAIAVTQVIGSATGNPWWTCSRRRTRSAAASRASTRARRATCRAPRSPTSR